MSRSPPSDTDRSNWKKIEMAHLSNEKKPCPIWGEKGMVFAHLNSGKTKPHNWKQVAYSPCEGIRMGAPNHLEGIAECIRINGVKY